MIREDEDVAVSQVVPPFLAAVDDGEKLLFVCRVA
jgi:hypothetical protein